MPGSLVAEAAATAATAPTVTAPGAGATVTAAPAASTTTAAGAPTGGLRPVIATAAAGLPPRGCWLASLSIVAICVVEVVLLASKYSGVGSKARDLSLQAAAPP